MGASTMSDFAVGSNGRCFFCLNQIMELKPPQNISLPLKTQTNSLHYLARYLKMDLKKVFIDKQQVSPGLLEKIKMARLKVELCEECRCLSERFSKVYRQLEKLELELEFTVSLIYGKLLGADATDKLPGTAPGLSSNWNGLLEVLDVLRTEAIEKSSYKLSDTPRVKIKHVTKAEVNANQSVPESEEGSSKMATNADVASCHRLQSGVKTEFPNDDSLSDNNNGNYFSKADNSNLDNDSMNGNLEMESALSTDDNTVKRNMLGYKEVASRTAKKLIDTGKCSIDPTTGKRSCKDCSKEFNGAAAFTIHYQTIHLKIRYKCVSCSKLFSQNSHLRQHQRTSRSCSEAESATKFKCHLCEKNFTRKDYLKEHLEGVHYKLQKYACNLCGKKFNHSTSWISSTQFAFHAKS